MLIWYFTIAFVSLYAVMPKKISANRDYFSRTLHFLCIFFWGDFVCIVQTCVHIFNDLCVCFSPAHQIVISRTYGNRTVLVPHVQTIPQAVMYIYIHTQYYNISLLTHTRAHDFEYKGTRYCVFCFHVRFGVKPPSFLVCWKILEEDDMT